MANAKPIFDKRIFWDVDPGKIDYDGKANWVIERVFERGDVEDIRRCRRYYGDEKVEKALLNAKYLSKPTLYLAAAVTGKEITEFRCYTQRLLNQPLYPF
ncbi:MAG: hypothetical protein JST83_06965 [Bacteroidetes bacterium]|nr:hypothetical protein [Bacteroidota bacterium]